MQTKFFILSIIFFFSNAVFGQQVVGEWDCCTSFLDVQDIQLLDGKVYAATTGGLIAFSPEDKSLNTYNMTDGFSGVNLECLGVDKFGMLWIGTSQPRGSINIWDPQKDRFIRDIYKGVLFERIDRVNSIAFYQNRSFAAFQQNVDWGIHYFTVQEGIYRYNDYFVSFPLDFGAINSLDVVRDTLWVATSAGLLFADLSQTDLKPMSAWDVISFPERGNVPNVIDWKGQVVTAMDTMVYRLENGIPQRILKKFPYEIESLSLDPQDSLMVVSPRGIFRFAYGAWRRLASGDFACARNDNLGNIWIGSSQKAIGRINNDEILYITPNTMLDNAFTTLWIEPDGQLVAGTKKGIGFRTDRGWYNIYRRHDNISIHSEDNQNWDRFIADTIAYNLGSRIYNIVRRGDGQFFASLYGSRQRYLRPGGLLRFDPENLSAYEVYDTTDQKLAASAGKGGADDYLGIGYIALDAHDNLWIANQYAQNDSVIAILTANGDWYHFSISDANNYIGYWPTAIAFDSQGRVWIASEVHGGDSPNPSPGGIAVLDYNGTLRNKDDDEWTWVTTHDDLADNSVFFLAFDQNSDLWIMTAGGIQRAALSPNFPDRIFDFIDPPVLTSVPFAKECRIRVDRMNNKWISTVGDGVKVYTYEGIWLNDVEGFTTDNSPLLSNTALDIAFHDPEGLVYIATTNGISIYKSPYAVYGNQYRSLKIFPMPFRIPTDRELVIDGLLQDSEVKIMTLDGTFIRHLTSLGGEVVGQQAFWDGKNRRGKYVSSGVYICVAYTKEGDTTTDKIAVIRE